MLKKADYADRESLISAFQGQDVLVEAFNPAAAIHQKVIIEAALAAGIKHVITPDFSGDTFNPNIGEIYLFNTKIKAQKELEEAVAASGGKLSWTAIINGPWYDWLIERDYFWIKREARTITRYGDGNQKLSISKFSINGDAVVAVLKNPDGFRNRPAYFESHSVSMNELIAIVQDLDLRQWEIIDVPLDEHLAEARKLWNEDTAKGVTNRLGSKAYLMLSAVALLDQDNRYGGHFGDRAEPGWNEDEAALRDDLRRLLA